MIFQKEIVKKIVIIIEEEDIDANFDIETVSTLSGYSKWHLQRSFYKYMGVKIGTFIRRRRLIRSACQLIETEMKIIDLSLLAGFSSQQSFTRTFNNTFKMTPANFRKKKTGLSYAHS
ncbi:TPA: helix-turn-helix domain-containing protein [Serratia marcescens]